MGSISFDSDKLISRIIIVHESRANKNPLRPPLFFFSAILFHTNKVTGQEPVVQHLNYMKSWWQVADEWFYNKSFDTKHKSGIRKNVVNEGCISFFSQESRLELNIK